MADDVSLLTDDRLPASPASAPRRRRPFWQRWAIRLSVLYAMILLAVVLGFTDRLILFPTTDPIDVGGVARHEVTVPGGGMVEVFSARSPGADATGEPQAYVLAFIGNAARAELTAPYFAHDWGKRPVEVWAVNYPGYGKSSGAARLKQIPPAALAAYDDLQAHANGTPILVEGRSLGTTAALYLATQRPVAGCILHNPPPLRQLILGKFGWWNLWLVATPVALSVPKELDSLANASNLKVPAIFALAGADEVVPPAYQEKVAAAYAGEKRFVRAPTALHNDPLDGDALDQYEAAMDWMWARVVRH